jgi:drug/metabolite transporter (DMT)-like permease
VGLVACAAAWGMIFVGVAKLLPHIDAAQIVTVRFGLVALCFAAAFAARPSLVPRLDRRGWLLVAACGVLCVPGSQYAIVEAQNYLSPPLASLIVTSSPAVAAVIAAGLLRERLGVATALGFAIALGGVALILVAGSGSGVHASNPGGAVVALITPVSWALYTLALKPLTRRCQPVGAIGAVMIAGALSLAPVYPHAAAGLHHMSGTDWMWMAILVGPATVVPNLLWFVGVRRLPVHQRTAFMYVIPVFATLWTAAILGRQPPLVTIPGGLLVLAGVALTQTTGRAAVDVAP